MANPDRKAASEITGQRKFSDRIQEVVKNFLGEERISIIALGKNNRFVIFEHSESDSGLSDSSYTITLMAVSEAVAQQVKDIKDQENKAVELNRQKGEKVTLLQIGFIPASSLIHIEIDILEKNGIKTNRELRLAEPGIGFTHSTLSSYACSSWPQGILNTELYEQISQTGQETEFIVNPSFTQRGVNNLLKTLENLDPQDQLSTISQKDLLTTIELT